MRYQRRQHPETGLCIPVASLRREGHGVGEFVDLLDLGAFAREVGFDLVQILPVQDTGFDSSPYAGVSALALHPLYLRIEDVEGSAPFVEAYLREQAPLATRPRLAAAEVLRSKLGCLRQIFETLDRTKLETRLDPFALEQSWVHVHAAYKILKQRHDQKPWFEWPEYQNPDPTDLEEILESNRDEWLFHVWVQDELDRQLRRVGEGLADMGLHLKGDVPILLHDDSAEVWFHRELFDRSASAGAPPDMYSDDGQYWSFPCYDWDRMARDDFAWWRRRLRHAARYFHALRIDHVLGFFRIWRIPDGRRSGRLGYFDPTVLIERQQLHDAGLSDELLARLLAPGGRHLEAEPTEIELMEITDPDERRQRLVDHADRVLLDPIGEGKSFAPVWQWYDKPQFRQLPEPTRRALESCFHHNEHERERLWERVGRERLAIVAESTQMLICAEDLGVVPACVAPVLEELGILGLRVERWQRAWHEPDQPFHSPEHFEAGTVCAPGIHDAASLRAWWEEDEAVRRVWWQRALGRDGEPPATLEVWLLEEVLRRNLSARSQLCVLMMPDCLALDGELRPADPKDERINVPATESETNWSYRMPLTLTELSRRAELSHKLAALIAERRERGG